MTKHQFSNREPSLPTQNDNLGLLYVKSSSSSASATAAALMLIKSGVQQQQHSGESGIGRLEEHFRQQVPSTHPPAGEKGFEGLGLTVKDGGYLPDIMVSAIYRGNGETDDGT
jgi:hypothetical protein